MTSSNQSPDPDWAGFAHQEDDNDPDHQMPPGPFAITSMPAVPPQRYGPRMGKLDRTVAGPTGGDDS